MVRPHHEIKFSAPLVQAIHVLRTAKETNNPVVFVPPTKEFLEETLSMAKALAPHLSQLWGIKLAIHVWNAPDHSVFSPVASSLNLKTERLRTLRALYQGPNPSVIFCLPEAWIQPTIPQALYQANQLTLSIGTDIRSLEELRTQLRNMGYVRSETVEEPGQYCIRGEICDLFDPAYDHPLRIELFDTQVEQIRPFHPGTQRTQAAPIELSAYQIGPAEEALLDWSSIPVFLETLKDHCDRRSFSRKYRDPIFENIKSGYLPEQFRTWLSILYKTPGSLAEHLGSSVTFFVFDPELMSKQIQEYLESERNEAHRYKGTHWIAPAFEAHFQQAKKLLGQLTQAHSGPHPAPIHYESISGQRITEAQIRDWIEDGFAVWIGARGLTHREKIRYFVKDLLQRPGFKILDEDPVESAEFIHERLIILSETLLFGKQAVLNKKPPRSKLEEFKDDETAALTHIQDLSPGDFVVHTLHGVGKYIGLQEINPGGTHHGEYLLIEYDSGDKLYLPIYRLNTIQRYVGAGAHPRIDKLGSNHFEKAKQKARESARKLAVNLIDIYAKRAVLKGPKFDPPGSEYEEFCDEFEFSETEGQLKATQDILQDLQSGKLLDRLVCGDVGFGKTEVAIRAAFQAVQSGYQVGVLVPTTLLAFQHEQSFKRRMSSHPIRIESISRFKPKKLQSETLKKLETGQIDIIIGTHRLLSKDVKFNRLGLLVVDEEHRFGVDHKEKIKAIQANTHTLTLTATPIPRTLNMALSGLKDISIIKTPPTNRQPIKTFVSHASDELIRSAIETELGRGGQVFYLYNRVQSIENRAKEIRELVPNAKVIVAHGQMSEDEIESKMLEFYEGAAQIMVCTTIIESGIDVPNAGTIIIHRADQLGLAQLYQIRGRVGRSHRKAFAYLLTDEERILTQEAKMRLDVLQRFVELGSGFQIASYDLEIRGGGNLLGAEQSGHIASVGLDLFTELLEEAIQELKGNAVSVEDLHFEPEIQIPVVAEIPSQLIPESKLRLSFYRRLSSAKTLEQADLIQDELRDRFGSLPIEVENLIWMIRIKLLLKKVGIENAKVTTEKITLAVRKTTLVDVDEVMKLYTGPKSVRDPRIQVTPDSKIAFKHPFLSLRDTHFELEALFRRIAPKAFEIQKTH
jgi:transcription-repair coupling factor (superfamily II helicase)